MILVRLLRDEKGATAIEFGLLVALISNAMIAALLSTGNILSDVFSAVATAMAA